MNVQTVSMMHFREMFANVSKKLTFANEKEKALEILKLCETTFPKERIPYFYDMPKVVEAYYIAGDINKADELAMDIANYYDKKLAYYMRLNDHFKSNVTNIESGTGLYILQELIKTIEPFKTPVSDKVIGIFSKYYHQ
jgi:hypothetical protein